MFEGDRIHCIDILDALTKNFLGGDLATGELGDLKKAPDRIDYQPISSLMKRQRENYAASVIQRGSAVVLEPSWSWQFLKQVITQIHSSNLKLV